MNFTPMHRDASVWSSAALAVGKTGFAKADRCIGHGNDAGTNECPSNNHTQLTASLELLAEQCASHNPQRDSADCDIFHYHHRDHRAGHLTTTPPASGYCGHAHTRWRETTLTS
uniref:Uncharacterized protein n=1 Tax=Mycobacterium leprae TaxID=1769 RepID=O32884_MYCLR|nr:hypothetical protein MLCB1779.22 [Mycobacterium leprae]